MILTDVLTGYSNAFEHIHCFQLFIFIIIIKRVSQIIYVPEMASITRIHTIEKNAINNLIGTYREYNVLSILQYVSVLCYLILFDD